MRGASLAPRLPRYAPSHHQGKSIFLPEIARSRRRSGQRAIRRARRYPVGQRYLGPLDNSTMPWYYNSIRGASGRAGAAQREAETLHEPRLREPGASELGIRLIRRLSGTELFSLWHQCIPVVGGIRFLSRILRGTAVPVVCRPLNRATGR